MFKLNKNVPDETLKRQISGAAKDACSILEELFDFHTVKDMAAKRLPKGAFIENGDTALIIDVTNVKKSNPKNAKKIFSFSNEVRRLLTHSTVLIRETWTDGQDRNKIYHAMLQPELSNQEANLQIFTVTDRVYQPIVNTNGDNHAMWETLRRGGLR